MIKKVSLKLVLHKSQTWQNLHRHNFNIVTNNSIPQDLTSCHQPLNISPSRSSQLSTFSFFGISGKNKYISRRVAFGINSFIWFLYDNGLRHERVKDMS